MDKFTSDLINTYQFDYISTRHRTDQKIAVAVLW